MPVKPLLFMRKKNLMGENFGDYAGMSRGCAIKSAGVLYDPQLGTLQATSGWTGLQGCLVGAATAGWTGLSGCVIGAATAGWTGNANCA